MLDLDPIKKRLAEATPGPWGSCDDATCKCIMVTSRDYPVAEVTKGAWGDDFPSIRLVGPSLDLKAEAFMDQITYGEVSEEQFLANRRFIREAPTDVAALIAEIERLRAAQS